MSKLILFVAVCWVAATLSVGLLSGTAGYGPAMDPDGRHSPLAGAAGYGPAMDPDGRHNPLAGAAGYGPAMDPDGRSALISGD